MSATQFIPTVASIDELRLNAWCEGHLKDDELSDKEVEWLQVAIFDAIVNKKMKSQIKSNPLLN